MTEQIVNIPLMIPDVVFVAQQKRNHCQAVILYYWSNSFKKIEIRAISGHCVVHYLKFCPSFISALNVPLKKEIAMCDWIWRVSEGDLPFRLYCCCFLSSSYAFSLYIMHTTLDRKTWFGECVVIFEPLIMFQSSYSYF